jgi:hypothetical protein
MPNDIVELLRLFGSSAVEREAADEIERLRLKLEMWQDGNIMAESHSEEVERLRAERDEARREILLWVKERCSWAELSQEVKKRGWDCFKEDGK